ncbi:MAG: hypothetical protein AAF587_12300 [Bacteroidota bacterium]
MRRFNLLWIFIFCSILSPFAWSQSQTSFPEDLVVHFDKAFYAAGEDVWFSVKFLDAAHPSNVVYTELIGPDGTFLSHQILLADGMVASGDLPLSPDLPTGYYEFRAFTSWNLQFTPQMVYRTYILIYHPKDAVLPGVPAPLDAYAPAVSQHIRLNMNAHEFGRRDSVSLSISPASLGVSGMTGQVSLSVMDVRYVQSADHSSSEQSFDELRTNYVAHPEFFEPEKEYTLRFRMRYPTDQQLVNSSFVYAFVKATQQKVIQKAYDGLVTFSFGEFYDSTVVQVFDADPFRRPYIPDIGLLPPPRPDIPPSPLDSEPPMNAAVGHYLALFRQRFQVNALFESNQQIRALRPKRKLLDLTPTSAYPVKDFPAVRTMDDFFKQIVNPASIKRAKRRDRKFGNNARRFKLYIPHKFPLSPKEVKKPPLLLVNDYFTYDSDAILNTDWYDIEQVDVFNTANQLPVQFGPIGSFGVIAFYTYDGETPDRIKDAPNNLKVQGFYRPRRFPAPTPVLNQDLSKIPFLSPLMYWSPNISLNSSQTTTINFLTGDQKGKYLVRVQGFWADGRPILGETVIEVR